MTDEIKGRVGVRIEIIIVRKEDHLMVKEILQQSRNRCFRRAGQTEISPGP
ncbi:MAG: hypothetical protein AABY92_10555 [Thermodesulfobacteriota bacterium]